MIAISVFARERNTTYLAHLLSVVDPDNRDKVRQQFRGLLFPEEGYDDLKYLKKAKAVFEKLKNVNLRGYLGF